MRNSTIIPRKRNLGCGHFDFNFSKNRCKACATVASTNKRWEAHEDAEETESLQNLCDDADHLFSRYIRLKHARPNGMVQCYTGGTWMRWQDAQCGHCFSRKDYGVRWLESNCRPQSKHENEVLRGNIDVFKAKLEAETPGIVEYLQEQARLVVKPTREEMRELIASLRFKLKIAESKLKKP